MRVLSEKHIQSKVLSVLQSTEVELIQRNKLGRGHEEEGNC